MRREVGDVDAMSQRHRELGQVIAAPVDVAADDDKLYAVESIDEIAHSVREVSAARCRVTEVNFLVGQHVAATYMHTNAHEVG